MDEYECLKCLLLSYFSGGNASEGLANVSINKKLQVSKEIQEHRLQEIKQMCKEHFKIEPMSLEAETQVRKIPLQFRERLQTTFVNDDYKLLVTVVYKTGSEGWKNTMKQLFERGQNVSQKLLGSKSGIVTLSDVSNKLGAKAVSYRLQNYFSVIFVRHPYSRLLSAYRSKFVRLPNQFYVNKARGIIRRVRKGSIPKDRTPDLQFPEIVEYVANGGWDEHWCPIFKDKKPCHIYYDFIGHLETFETDVEYLFHLTGISDIVDFPDCSHATGSADLDVLKHYFSNISQPLLTKLNARYKDDFKIFGYHLPANNSDLDYVVNYKSGE